MLNKKTLLLIMSLILLYPQAIDAQDYLTVGKIICKNAKVKCKITRDDARLNCCTTGYLCNGDIIESTASEENIKIHLEPYAEMKSVGEHKVQVVYRPPTLNRGLADIVAGYFGKYFLQISKAPKRDTPVYSSFLGDEFNVPRPSTLLSTYPVEFFFFSENDASNIKHLITLKDSGGHILFSQEVTQADIPKLIPADIGMRRNEKYSLYIADKKYPLLLRDEEMEKIITNDLEALSNLDKNSIEKALDKAAYLQIVSDMHPERVALYWLSYQMLPKNITSMSESQKQKYHNLKERVINWYNLRKGA